MQVPQPQAETYLAQAKWPSASYKQTRKSACRYVLSLTSSTSHCCMLQDCLSQEKRRTSCAMHELWHKEPSVRPDAQSVTCGDLCGVPCRKLGEVPQAVWAEAEEAGDGAVLHTVLLHPRQEVEAAFGGLVGHSFRKTCALGLSSGIHVSHCVDPRQDLWAVGLATTLEETFCTPCKPVML